MDQYHVKICQQQAMIFYFREKLKASLTVKQQVKVILKVVSSVGGKNRL